jgi:arylsulfatase
MEIQLSSMMAQAAQQVVQQSQAQAAQQQAQQQQAQQKPNILFIMGDDIGWMQVGAYQNGLSFGNT